MSREYTFGGELQTTSIASGPSALITRARRALRSSLSSLASADTAAAIVSATTRTLRRSVFFMKSANLLWATVKTRNRHPSVRRPGTCAGPESERRVERLVSRLPQPLAIFEPRRPLEPAAAALGSERLNALGLFPDVPIVVAMEFEEQRRRD